jgi:UDP-glucose 4-epimerase
MNAEAYNIGSGQMSKISHAVQLLLKFLDKNNEVNYNGNTRIGNPNKWQSDISKIKNIGFVPEVNLEMGLLSLANWLKSLP